MSDLATISASGTITNLSAAYLLTCWRVANRLTTGCPNLL